MTSYIGDLLGSMGEGLAVLATPSTMLVLGIVVGLAIGTTGPASSRRSRKRRRRPTPALPARRVAAFLGCGPIHTDPTEGAETT